MTEFVIYWSSFGAGFVCAVVVFMCIGFLALITN